MGSFRSGAAGEAKALGPANIWTAASGGEGDAVRRRGPAERSAGSRPKSLSPVVSNSCSIFTYRELKAYQESRGGIIWRREFLLRQRKSHERMRFDCFALMLFLPSPGFDSIFY